MTGYKVANLDLLLKEIGEEKTRQILADYLCPLNQDVEDFLKRSAIPFSNQGLAKTHLVFASKNDVCALAGYFTLATKVLLIKRSKKLGSKLNSRLRKFSRIIDETDTSQISAPLIAQLGKNFCDNNDRLISGDELLKIACDKVQNIHSEIGGKVVYLECEDKPKLCEFYERNGFREFDRRPLDKSDRDIFKSDYLIQMIRYF